MILLADGGMIMMVRVSVGQVGIYDLKFLYDVSPVIVFLATKFVKICIYFLMRV